MYLMLADLYLNLDYANRAEARDAHSDALSRFRNLPLSEKRQLVHDLLKVVVDRDEQLVRRNRAARLLGYWPGLIEAVPISEAVQALSRVIENEYAQSEKFRLNWSNHVNVEEILFFYSVVGSIFFLDYQAGQKLASQMPAIAQDLGPPGWLEHLSQCAKASGERKRAAE
jgi:hypothetical protein